MKRNVSTTSLAKSTASVDSGWGCARGRAARVLAAPPRRGERLMVRGARAAGREERGERQRAMDEVVAADASG